jgi:hypothetical protein
MKWDDLLKLLLDVKKNEPDVLNERATMIIDNERWFCSITEDMVSGRLSITPAFDAAEEEEDDDQA